MRGLEGLDEATLYRVVKMRFPDKAGKLVVRYNDHITLASTPSRSALDCCKERPGAACSMSPESPTPFRSARPLKIWYNWGQLQLPP